MAVILFVTLAICFVSAFSLKLSPPWYLGSYTREFSRWPYGGCVEVSKIYPAPNSHLPPILNKYAKDWNLTITVVFSRPVTRIIWRFNNRTRFRLTPPNIPLDRTCTRSACLFLKQGKSYFIYMPISSEPTQRGNFFNDEFEFTFTVPAFAKDHASQYYFALDGGWMYSPVFKFMSDAHVEYVPYVLVRYLPPFDDSDPRASRSRLPARDNNYWVNYPSTCAVRGGLMHRGALMDRFGTSNNQKYPNADSPKLLKELSEVVSDSNKKRKLKLYYQLKEEGIHTFWFPETIKALDRRTNLKISVSAPGFKFLDIIFTTPRLYIPVTTEYVFDFRERAYHQRLKWVPYFFTYKKSSQACRGRYRFFDCNAFVYNSVFPNSSLHQHHMYTRHYAAPYRTVAEARAEVNIRDGVNIVQYHSLNVSDNELFPFSKYHGSLWDRTRLVSGQIQCVKDHDNSGYCYRSVDKLALEPYWKMTVIYGKYTHEVLDRFMISDELKDTLYKSEGMLNDNGFVGMMRYSATGSVYEKDMSDVVPLVKYREENLRPASGLLTRECHFNAKRNVGKWGRLNTFIEYGNMYQLHRSKPSKTWAIQQIMYARYITKSGQTHDLSATIIGYPEHIRKAVERYAVLTNVQAAKFNGRRRDTRLKASEESYPLDQAIFVSRKLANMRGCGTLRISNEDISSMRAKYLQKYHSNFFEHLCDKPPDDCTGLPLDSVDRFPLIPPFNILNLVGPVRKAYDFNRKALYYRDNTVDGLFILQDPSLQYTGVVEIDGVEIKDPEYVERSCNKTWMFSPGRYEITKGRLTGTIINKGKGGSDVVVTVQCTPKLGISPERATVWVDPYHTINVTFVLSGYLMETTEERTSGYKCEMTMIVDVTPYTSIVGKTLPVCKMFIPTFGGSFVDPCDSYLDHDITYYNLPREFAHDLSLETFLSSAIGREYELLKLISVKLVKYHMIRISCGNNDVLALTEDQLIIISMNVGHVGKYIDLTYTINKLLQQRIYLFIKRQLAMDGTDGIKTECLITMISSPHANCGLASRKLIALTKADVPVAVALREEEEVRKTVIIEKSIWNKWISEREEVISAVLVCTVTSLVLMVLVVTGNSGLFIYNKLSSSEKRIMQMREELQTGKREHKKTWNNPQMYLVKGILGPHYILYNFKATDALDTANLKVLKIAGTLKYKEKTLQVIFGHVKKVMIQKTRDGKVPHQIWLQASSGMYLLKQKYVNKEYKEEFDSILQRQAKSTTL